MSKYQRSYELKYNKNKKQKTTHTVSAEKHPKIDFGGHGNKHDKIELIILFVLLVISGNFYVWLMLESIK